MQIGVEESKYPVTDDPPPIYRSGRGHVTNFWNLGTPSISRELVGARNFKFGASKHNVNVCDDQWVKSKPEV